MTDKTEAQPEALRLADELIEQAAHHRELAHCCDCRPEDTVNWDHYLQCGNAATELRRQHAEIQQLKAEKAEMAELNFENYEFQRKKADAATATVYRFHYAMKDAGWHPGRTDDDLTDIIRAKGRELAQLSARQAAPDDLKQLLRNLLQESCEAEGETYLSNEHYRKIQDILQSPPPPEREPLTDEQIAGLDNFLRGTVFGRFARAKAFARGIERRHGIGAPNAR